MELIDTECVFHAPAPGGIPLPSGDCAYGSRDGSRFTPHLVIGDPTQREAIIDRSKVPPEITEEYLGVAFWAGESPIVPDQTLNITMALIYFPNLSYANVVDGATFTIRLGPKILGYGKVIRRYSNTAPSSR